QFSTRVKDEKGMPSFALVNKATGQAIKHSIAETNPVRLVPYNPNYLDQEIRKMEESMMEPLSFSGNGRMEKTSFGRSFPTIEVYVGFYTFLFGALVVAGEEERILLWESCFAPVQ
ncbi:hypothetical protein MKW98_004769, partial [Papaver atlanticum]